MLLLLHRFLLNFPGFVFYSYFASYFPSDKGESIIFSSWFSFLPIFIVDCYFYFYRVDVGQGVYLALPLSLFLYLRNCFNVYRFSRHRRRCLLWNFAVSAIVYIWWGWNPPLRRHSAKYTLYMCVCVRIGKSEIFSLIPIFKQSSFEFVIKFVYKFISDVCDIRNIYNFLFCCLFRYVRVLLAKIMGTLKEDENHWI